MHAHFLGQTSYDCLIPSEGSGSLQSEEDYQEFCSRILLFSFLSKLRPLLLARPFGISANFGRVLLCCPKELRGSA